MLPSPKGKVLLFGLRRVQARIQSVCCAWRPHPRWIAVRIAHRDDRILRLEIRADSIPAEAERAAHSREE